MIWVLSAERREVGRPHGFVSRREIPKHDDEVSTSGIGPFSLTHGPTAPINPLQLLRITMQLTQTNFEGVVFDAKLPNWSARRPIDQRIG